MNKLKDNERIICPAIWIDDGKVYELSIYDNQPINIKTGWVYYGQNIVDIFRRMYHNRKTKLINNNLSISKVNEGYFTNLKRFIHCIIEY